MSQSCCGCSARFKPSGSRTASAGRRRALREQVQWITEVAGRTIESPHDRERVERRLARVRAALETESILLAEAE